MPEYPTAIRKDDPSYLSFLNPVIRSAILLYLDPLRLERILDLDSTLYRDVRSRGVRVEWGLQG